MMMNNLNTSSADLAGGVALNLTLYMRRRAAVVLNRTKERCGSVEYFHCGGGGCHPLPGT